MSDDCAPPPPPPPGAYTSATFKLPENYKGANELKDRLLKQEETVP
jgi:hypothetical protein